MVTTPTIQVASFGMWDSLILMVMALVVFGPRRLPEIGRQIGRLLYEVRKASNDFKFQMEEELRNAEEADRRKKEDERLRLLALSAPAQTAGTIETNSQFSAAASGTPGESPYSGEAIYPPVIPAAAEVSAEETYPRILPPSTGEPAPAERPASAGPGLIDQDFTPGIEAAESTEAGSSVNSATNLPVSPASKVSQTDGPAPQQPRPDPEQAPHG
jgi:sec-independent protein translocase protein TatB